MASEKQLRANRANARRGTGPTSASGKARASVNALKHGLTAKTLLIMGEVPAQLERFLEELETECAPNTEKSRRLVQQLAGVLWRLRRISQFEASIIVARAAEVTPMQTLPRKELLLRAFHEKMAALYRSDEKESDPPDLETTARNLLEAKDPIEGFWIKVGVALTGDAQLLSTLANLSRYEAGLLNRLIKTLQLLTSGRGSAAKKKVVAGRASHADAVPAKSIVVVGEDPVEFEKLRDSLTEEYAPRTRVQLELLDYIAGVFWRVERMPAMEAAMLEALRKEIVPDEIDREEEQKRIRRLDEIADRYLPPQLRNQETSAPASAPKEKADDEQSNHVVGLVLIRDSQTRDALGKLSRYEAAMTNGLSRALQLLSALQAAEKA